MNKQEAAVIEMYTGVCMLTGDNTEFRYKYAESLLGYPVMTHDFADKETMNKLAELSKPDFIEICRNLAD